MRTGVWWDIQDTLPHVSTDATPIFDDLDSPGEQDMQYTTTHDDRSPLPDGRHNVDDVRGAVQARRPNFI
jgi:hypothetical protein